MNRRGRQEVLQTKFHFTCTCRLCSSPTERSLGSDRRIEEIGRLESLIGGGGLQGILSTPLRTLRYVEQQVRLYNEQAPGDSGLARAFFDATQIAIANGYLARGVVFAEKAVDSWRASYGSDSREVIEYEPLVQNPTQHSLYRSMSGLSWKWKTSVDETPRGLEGEAFEDWLWKREKAKQPGQFASLRSHVLFPPFVDLPNDYDVDLEASHWCYLGEIVDSTVLLRLQLEIKDIDEKSIPLYFYTDDRGNEVSPAQLQKGHTVAVVDARHHRFAFGEPGIRHENPKNMKIFPLSLDELLALNDQIQEFSTTNADGMRKCHGCSKEAPSLQKCARCSYFWYCSKDCQIHSWHKKGHKATCKHLKDSGLRGLLFFKWGKYDGGLKFPLPLD